MPAALDRRDSTDSLVSSSVSLNRSRTWSDNVQKHWNMPVLPAESFEQRLERYSEYFSLKESQIQHVYRNLLRDIEKGVAGTLGEFRARDTCLTQLPRGSEYGVHYALDFSGTYVHAIRVKLEGNGKTSMLENKVNIREKVIDFPKGLLDKKCGAMELFDFLAACVKDLMQSMGDLGPKKPVIPIGFSVSFPITQRGLQSASLTNWTKGFETGRGTDDPVEGLDLGILLDMAFWRADINARTSCVINDASASLIACEYEKPRKLPPCTVAFLCGVGVNGAYVELNAANCGYKGNVLITELGRFDAGLPVTDIDLEVDFADEGGQGQQMLEKMIGGGYLGEIGRRLIVKVYQSNAPPLAWARQSMPTAAAALIVSDHSEDLDMTRRMVQGLWDWETDYQTREIIQKLFTLVFSRSAALSAVCIAALAKMSGRLQPAMGGVTVAVDATFHASHPWFTQLIQQHLKTVLGETARFINLYVLHDGAGKGAAILSNMMASN